MKIYCLQLPFLGATSTARIRKVVNLLIRGLDFYPRAKRIKAFMLRWFALTSSSRQVGRRRSRGTRMKLLPLCRGARRRGKVGMGVERPNYRITYFDRSTPSLTLAPARGRGRSLICTSHPSCNRSGGVMGAAPRRSMESYLRGNDGAATRRWPLARVLVACIALGAIASWHVKVNGQNETSRAVLWVTNGT